MLAAAVGIPSQYITQIETFKWYPKIEKLEDIADCLGTDVATMFPEWVREQRVKRSSYEREVLVDSVSLENPEAKMIEAPQDMDELVDKALLHDIMPQVLEVLTPRLQKVLRMKHGIAPETRPHTLEEIGQELGVTRERIRQMEAKAMAMIRRNGKSRELLDKPKLIPHRYY